MFTANSDAEILSGITDVRNIASKIA